MEPALPRTWPRRARSAMLHALSLARIAVLAATNRVAASIRVEHEPVNRFPDLVAHLVRPLKVLCPAMGTARLATVLSRAGLHLGRTTVRRMLKRRPRRVAPAATARSERRIRSLRPNHIWLLDLTTVPTLAGFWIPWLPWSLPRRCGQSPLSALNRPNSPGQALSASGRSAYRA